MSIKVKLDPWWKSELSQEEYDRIVADTLISGYERSRLLSSVMAGYFKKLEIDKIEAMRFKFEARVPEIGEQCIVRIKQDACFFGCRSSQNFFQCGSEMIRADTPGLIVITLAECEATE